MASFFNFIIFSSILIFFSFPELSSAVLPRKLALVPTPDVVLNDHHGPLLIGNITVNFVWYGGFSTVQRSVITDFFLSLNAGNTPMPSVSSWWSVIGKYRGGPRRIVVGKQILVQRNSNWKVLENPEIVALAQKAGGGNKMITVVLTSSDVAVEDFCMNQCGMHGAKKSNFVYLWVGNPGTQCPGQCAWPFHRPTYGPQSAPLIAPNGDVGLDGMIINLATVLAGSVTNPFDNGYYQGPAEGSLEAVSACTGIFGTGAFPGYPGKLLVDKTTRASYNAVGINGRKYLLPAVWDPTTSKCTPNV